MTTHDHSKYTPGCFRCDLSRSEVQQAIREDLEPFSDPDLLDELVQRGVLREVRVRVVTSELTVPDRGGPRILRRRYVSEWEQNEGDA